MDLYQDLMGGQASQSQSQQTPQNNNFINNLQNFASTFKGDPKQQVMQLMQQRGISQDTFNNAVAQTNQLYKMLNRK